MSKIRNKKGVTLVELIVIIAVSAIVLMPFSFLVVSSLRNEVLVQKEIDVQHNIQSSFIVLNELIRGEGFKALSLDKNPKTNAHDGCLKIGEDKVYQNGSDLVYLKSGETDEAVLNSYIHNVTYSLTNEKLTITFEIDKNDDNAVDDTFVFEYANRE